MEQKWRIEGYDAFDGELYSISGQYDSREEAEKAALEEYKKTEYLQPTESSGGQFNDGIQDRIYIINPEGEKIRFMPYPTN